MYFISAFDVIGPNMIGPSSSHTAGAVAMALLAGKLFQRPVKKVRFTLYGSFAKTYRGHGTDRAVIGGILGFSTDDVRIKEAFVIAGKRGLEYTFVPDEKKHTRHPNTVDILMEDEQGYTMQVTGESTGGGKIRIICINGIDVDFTGEYSTLIVKQNDKPGVVAHITQCLSHHNVNIAFMRLFRESKGSTAYTVVESDEKIPQRLLDEINENDQIHETMLIQA